MNELVRMLHGFLDIVGRGVGYFAALIGVGAFVFSMPEVWRTFKAHGWRSAGQFLLIAACWPAGGAVAYWLMDAGFTEALAGAVLYPVVALAIRQAIRERAN